jgi:hypothetical protein
MQIFDLLEMELHRGEINEAEYAYKGGTASKALKC